METKPRSCRIVCEKLPIAFLRIPLVIRNVVTQRPTLSLEHHERGIVDVQVSGKVGHRLLPNVIGEPHDRLARLVLLGARTVTAGRVGSSALLGRFTFSTCNSIEAPCRRRDAD